MINLSELSDAEISERLTTATGLEREALFELRLKREIDDCQKDIPPSRRLVEVVTPALDRLLAIAAERADWRPCPRDSAGWKIPRENTYARKIYDLAKEGRGPLEIAKMARRNPAVVKKELARIGAM